MKQAFYDSPDDCQWLRDTALKGCDAVLHAVDSVGGFYSFVLYGNEDAPYKVDLYLKADPLYTDRRYIVRFHPEPGCYCIGEWKQG